MKCKDCIYLSDEKTKIGRRCVNPEKHWQRGLAMWKYPTTPACKMAEPRPDYHEEPKEVKTVNHDLDEATAFLCRRLDRCAIHLRATEQMDLSTDIDLGIAKIKEQAARISALEEIIRKIYQEDDGK